MSPPPDASAPSSGAKELRRLLGWLVGAVLVLDVIAITLFSLLHIADAVPRVRYIFGGVWVGLTLFIVLSLLARIRAARVRNRRRGASRIDR